MPTIAPSPVSLKPSCGTCPVADKCALRATRGAGESELIEEGLEMTRHRKGDDPRLSDFARRRFMIVQRGSMKIMAEDGNALEILGAGEVHIPPTHPDTPNRQARSLESELVLCSITEHQLETLMSSRPALIARILKTLTDRRTRDQSSFLWTMKTLRHRAIFLLHDLMNRYGVRYGQFRMINVPLTKIELASLMGSVTESTVRTLSELRESGLISANGKRLVILDPSRLTRMRDEITEEERRSRDQDGVAPIRIAR